MSIVVSFCAVLFPFCAVLCPFCAVLFVLSFEVISVCIKLFADDAKLYTTVDSIEKTQCLQESLGSAVEWADTWNMFYNDAKCHHLHIGSRDLGVNYVIPSHQGLTTLEKVTNE